MPLLLSFKLDLRRGCDYRGEHQRHKGVGSSDAQLHCHVLNVQIWVAKDEKASIAGSVGQLPLL